MNINPKKDIPSYNPQLRPELAFPCLTDDMIARIRPYGQDICFPRDSLLFKPGERDVDMFAILEGSIDIYALEDDGEHRNLIVRLQGKQFSGELDLFNSHCTMVHACTGEDSALLRISRSELQRLMRSEGDIANLIMQAMIWRRQGLLADESTAMMVWAEAGLPETVQLQRFLMRNGYPHRMTVPTPSQWDHLRAVAPASMEHFLPAVVLRDGRLLFNPTTEHLADELGITQLPNIGVIYDVYYAATAMEANLVRGHQVAVVGGGNSAGQAALFLSGVASHVHLILRGKKLSGTMSHYLISRIESSDRITLHRNTEITGLAGDTTLSSVTWGERSSGQAEPRPIRGVFVMIGAEPNTGWLFGTLQLDKKGFIVTGTVEAFEPSRYATSVPGIFAIGDVRSTSVKRVASAVGEGSIVISDVHRFLAEDYASSLQEFTRQHMEQPIDLQIQGHI